MVWRVEGLLLGPVQFDPEPPPVKVYADGGCDPKGPAGPRASYGVHWPGGQCADTAGPVPGKHQTAVAGEVMAAATAIVQSPCRIHLIADS